MLPLSNPAPGPGFWNPGRAFLVDGTDADSPAMFEPGDLAAPGAECGSGQIFGGSVEGHFGASYWLLERRRGDVASLARFAHRVECATFYMCAAFEQARVRNFDARSDARRAPARRSWFLALADTTFDRFRTLRRALLHDWTPSAEVEPYVSAAFYNLCKLTPVAENHLKQLFVRRPGRATEALVAQLDLLVLQIEGAVQLAADVDVEIADGTADAEAARLEAVQAEILARAGESLSLSKAAKRLGVSRQNLHKRIGTGSALGLMRGKEIVVPSIQFVGAEDSPQIVPHLRRIVSLFAEAKAGPWSALQFLVDHDPTIDALPLDALKAGHVEAATLAARAYLAMDES